MVHTTDCFQASAAKAFYQTHIRNGREDIDADPPIPFDPTTTTTWPGSNAADT